MLGTLGAAQIGAIAVLIGLLIGVVRHFVTLRVDNQKAGDERLSGIRQRLLTGDPIQTSELIDFIKWQRKIGKRKWPRIWTRQVDFSHSKLKKVDLRKQNLRSSNFFQADLGDADLDYIDLRESDLTEANLNRANLRGANLSKTNLYKANLNGAYLRGANLSEATMDGADLRGAHLGYANLRGVNLSSAKMNGTSSEYIGIEWDEKTVWPPNMDRKLLDAIRFDRMSVQEQVELFNNMTEEFDKRAQKHINRSSKFSELENEADIPTIQKPDTEMIDDPTERNANMQDV